MRLLLCLICALAALPAKAQSGDTAYPPGEGFYKEMFINSGPSINTSTRKHAEHLQWGFEEFRAYHRPHEVDQFVDLVAGNDWDHNGVLLYPDGAPRFRMITVGASQATEPGGDWKYGGSRHMNVLNRWHHGSTALRRIQHFVRNGGGYAGFCAGFLITDNMSLLKLGMNYISAYPELSFASPFIVPSYDTTLTSVWQQGGGYIVEREPVPGLERLATTRIPGPYGTYDSYPVAWFYRDPAFPNAGRMLLSGVHPEISPEPAAVNLVATFFEDVVAHNPNPTVKATLTNGAVHESFEETGSHHLNHIKIGDGQYHHFRLAIPAHQPGPYLRVSLEGEPDADLHLFLNRGDFAFNGTSVQQDTSSGSQKMMRFDQLTQGDWYLGVKGASFPIADDENDPVYTDNLHVLNGIGYRLKVEWSATPFCDNSLSQVSVAAGNVCSGNPVALNLTVADCAVGPAAVTLHHSGGSQVATLNNHWDLHRGSQTGTFTLPGNLTTGRYRLQIRAANGETAFSDAFDITPATLSDATLSHTTLDPGQAVTLGWQASCDFASYQTTRISLQRTSGQTLFTVVRAASRAGGNVEVINLDQGPGHYRLVLNSNGRQLISPTLTINQPVIKTLSVSPTPVFANVPFAVHWDVSPGFDGHQGVLSLHNANGFIKTLAGSVSLQPGSRQQHYTLSEDEVGNGISGAFVRLTITGTHATTRDSSSFSIAKELITWTGDLPAKVFANQYLDMRYRLAADLPNGASARVFYLDESGHILQTLGFNYPGNAGEHQIRVPMIDHYKVPFRLRIGTADSSVAADTALFSLHAASLELVEVDTASMTVSWMWEGEQAAPVKVQVFDEQSGALLVNHTHYQGQGLNWRQNIFKPTAGRSYQLRLVTEGRFRPLSVTQSFSIKAQSAGAEATGE